MCQFVEKAVGVPPKLGADHHREGAGGETCGGSVSVMTAWAIALWTFFFIAIPLTEELRGIRKALEEANKR